MFIYNKCKGLVYRYLNELLHYSGSLQGLCNVAGVLKSHALTKHDACSNCRAKEQWILHVTSSSIVYSTLANQPLFSTYLFPHGPHDDDHLHDLMMPCLLMTNIRAEIRRKQNKLILSNFITDNWICDTTWAIDQFVIIELLTLSLSTQFQDSFGQNPILLPYSVTKLCNLCYLFLIYFFVFTPYFYLNLNFTFVDFVLASIDHIIISCQIRISTNVITDK